MGPDLPLGVAARNAVDSTSSGRYTGAVDLELRPIVDDEVEAFVRADSLAFGTTPDEHAVENVRSLLALDRSRAVFDGDRLVGASATIALQLTLPGLTVTPAAGVSWVGVVPTHRRRGILRAMMAALLDDATARGEPVALLIASEGRLYGRFSFGPATSRLSWEIDRRHGALGAVEHHAGSVEMVEGDDAAIALPPLFDRARLARPGDLDRSPAWWSVRLRDRPAQNGRSGTWFHVVHRGAGGPDGYATYRIESKWDNGVPRGRLVVQEVVAHSPSAEASLWSYLLSMDLTEVVEAGHRPADEPLRWMLADPRGLRVTGVADHLWVRLLDIPAALGARRYAVEAELVIEVTGAGGGRYRLGGGPDDANCEPTDAEPDVALGLAELGATYLGGVAPSTLAAAGRVAEQRPGALARADAMFVSHPAPFSRTHF